MNQLINKSNEDTHRRVALVDAGVHPGKAEQLAAIIRNIEDGTPAQAELANKKSAVLQVLIEQGIDMYSAFTVLFCAPSPDTNKKETHAS